jgi:glycosyltransferase 2 family protein
VTETLDRRTPAAGRRLRLAGTAISVASLAVVAWWAAHQQPPRLPSTPRELAAMGAAIVNYGITTVLRGERWRRLLVRAGAHPPGVDCQALTAVGFAGNDVLPARAGDVLRVVLMAPRAQTGRRTVIGTLLAERVLDAAVLLTLFGVLAYGVVQGAGSGLGHRRTEVLAALGIVVCALAVVVWFAARRGGAIARAVQYARPMLAATADLRSRFGLAMLGVSVVIWLLEACTWWLCGLAVNLGADPLEALYLVALASMFVLIPAGPGYAGTLDAAVVVGVRAIGGSGRAAFSYLLMLRFVLLVPITLVGMLLLVMRYGGAARMRQRRRWGPANGES